jgi:Zn-dependent protease
MLLALTAQEVQYAGIFLVAMVLSIAVHEFMHAYVAHRLGDPTPESDERLTLNPVAHADIVGTVLLPVVAALKGWPLFGWGKPVMTQPRYYSRKFTMRTGMALVAIAGPLGNLGLIFGVIVVVGLLSVFEALTPGLEFPLRVFLHLNVVLLVFNLLPIHPLDGGKILAAVLPRKWDPIDDFLAQYGMYILLILFVAGGSFLGAIFAPFYAAADWAWQLAAGVGG